MGSGGKESHALLVDHRFLIIRRIVLYVIVCFP